MKTTERIIIAALVCSVGACLASAAVPTSTAKPVGTVASDPAFAPIADDPHLPSVLLIGDSVSIGYTLAVREELAGVANVHRPAANCGSTKIALRDLEQWLGDRRWDVIHFNFGLHDLGYRWPDDTNLNAQGVYATAENGGHQNVPPSHYERNLREFVARLRRTGAKLIFATTTPVSADLHSYGRGAEQPYNAAALRVMRSEGITVDDLWAFVVPQIEQLQISGNPHFTAKGSAALARQVAQAVRVALPTPDATDRIIVSENFSRPDAVAQWRWGAGRWTVADGVLRGTETPERKHPAGIACQRAYHDAEIRFRFQFAGGTTAFLLLRNQFGNLCRVTISPSSLTITKDKPNSPANTPEQTVVLGKAPLKLKTGEWYSVTALVRGDAFAASVLGHATVSGRHPGIDVEKTEIEFLASGDSILFDDLRATVPLLKR